MAYFDGMKSKTQNSLLNTPINNCRHEIFANLIAQGNPIHKSYIEAGFKGGRSAASKLLTNVNILARVRVLREIYAAKHEITIAKILEELEKTRVLSIAMGQCHAAVTATMNKAKLAGLLENDQQLPNKGDTKQNNCDAKN